ncbi:MAG TPA: carboxypeptidase regulatory-like domain-containing protein [Planctomycetaceae bacterium]|jgi:beta-lactamase regulating signal transducer with metallopeptidase domain/protocatechuate 3,4-dioxygenase beta subunit|nr:carboxypeptidase regulatory-like domain-containing protein [Planctomycetaceae bacterium]
MTQHLVENNILLEWAQPVIPHLSAALVHFVWQGAIVGLLAALMLRLLAHSSAHARYAVLLASFTLMAACPPATFWLSARSIRSAHAITPANSQGGPPTKETAAGPTLTRTPTPLTDSPAAALAENVGPVVAPTTSLEQRVTEKQSAHDTRFESVRSVVETIRDWTWAHATQIVLAWLCGVALLSLRLAGGLYGAMRAKRHGVRPASDSIERLVAGLCRRLRVRRVVRVVESAWAEVPTVVGWLKPAILLPARALTGLTNQQLESLLAHELSHIRRHDALVNFLQSLVETFLFYHPAVWWLSSRIRQEREVCCDEIVIESIGDRAGYARALATLEGLRGLSGPAAVAATGGRLTARIKRILGSPEPSRTAAGVCVLGVVAFLLCLIGAAVCWPDRLAVANVADANGALADAIDGLAEAPGSNADDDKQDLTGTVVTPDGKPIRAIEVRAYPDHGSTLEMTRHTNDRGEFQFPRRWQNHAAEPEAAVTLVAIDDEKRLGWFSFAQHRYHRQQAAESNGSSSARGGHDPVRLVLLPLERVVTGRILNREGHPLSNVRVQVLRLLHKRYLSAGISEIGQDLVDNPFPHVSTDQEGRFRLRVPSETDFAILLRNPDWVTQRIFHGLTDSEKSGAAPIDMGEISLAPAGRIEGRIVEKRTGRALAGIKFYARGTTSEGRIGSFGFAWTDQNGRFQLDGLVPDFYNVSFYAPQNEPKLVADVHDPVRVEAGKAARADFSCYEGIPIRGRVIDSMTDKPLAKEAVVASVSKVANDDAYRFSRSADTDERGEFTLYVPAGICELSLSARSDVESLPDSNRTFDLSEGRSPDAVVLKRGPRRTATQQGRRVFKSTEQKAKTTTTTTRATTTTRPRPSLSVELRTKSDRPIGEVHVRHILVGRNYPYQWSRKVGPRFETEFEERHAGRSAFLLIDTPGFAQARTPEFVIGPDMEPLVVELKPPVYVPINGRVLNRQGAPLPAARIRIRRIIYGTDSQFPWGPESATDEQGRFTVKHVRVGDTVLVRVDSPSGDGADSQIFRVENPAPITLPDFQLDAPNGEISGLVHDQNRKPIPDVLVSYINGTKRETKTDRNGSFRLTGLPGGHVSLSFRAEDGSEITRLLEAGSTNADIFLPQQSLYNRSENRVTIQLRTSDGKAPSNAHYYLVDRQTHKWLQSGGLARQNHDIDLGQIAQRGRRDQVTLIVHAEGYAVPAPVPISLKSKTERMTVDLQAAPAVSVVGRVIGSDGKPVPGAALGLSINLIDSIEYAAWKFVSNLPERPTQVDQDGRGTFTGLSPGMQIAVYANAPGYAGAWSERVTLGAQDVTLQLRLARSTRTLSGRVVDADGHPIRGASLRIHDFGGPQTTSDESGRFRLSAVPDGKLLLVAMAYGYQDGHKTITTEDASREVVVKLPAEPNVLRPVSNALLQGRTSAPNPTEKSRKR